MAYAPYNIDTIRTYARKFSDILDTSGELSSVEIGDGNLNLVFKVSDRRGKSLIFKQALPYARVVGESWPLTTDRNRIEYDALRTHGTYAPQWVPQLYDVDIEQAVMVMEDLSDYRVMRTALIEGYKGTALYSKLGEYLAHTLFFTSDLAVNPSQKKLAVRNFINPELCRITELLIFTDPYYDADTNDIPSDIVDEAHALWADEDLKCQVAQLKMAFLTRAEALLHGDLHTGSIMVRGDDLRVFDAEFAFYGPIAFDVGLLIGNIVLNLVSNGPEFTDAAAADYWHTAIMTVWETFTERFSALWMEHAVDPVLSLTAYRETYLNRLLQETLGFAGAEVIRRTMGLAHVKDLDGIADPVARKRARLLALQVGRWSIVHAHAIPCINDYVDGLRRLLSPR